MSAPLRGLVYDVPEATYHADPGEGPTLSASIAHILDRKSPLHAWSAHPRLGGQRQSFRADLELGSLVHRLVLGSGPEIEIVDADDWRTKAARELRDAARASGRIPLLERDYAPAAATAKRLLERMADLGIVLSGRSEVTAFWPDDGVDCRGRFDHLVLETPVPKSAVIYDLKTTRSGRPEDCARSIEMYGYAIQRAAYVSALETISPHLRGRVSFVFVFVEVEPPYSVTPVELSGAFAALGERRWTRARELWRRCLERDEWPGYAAPGAPVVVAPPTWAEMREAEREAEEAAAAE